MNRIPESGMTVAEDQRLTAALRLLPDARGRLLEIGARDGRMTKRLLERFPTIVALDRDRPPFQTEGTLPLQGDVTALPFAARSFDIVVCTEVLEHVRGLEAACSELARVTGRHLLVGVPFEQDTRVGRMTCRRCGTRNPPWGHINAFSERILRSLFPTLQLLAVDYVGETKERTNWLSAFLMDLARNPWGTYHQEEPCVSCGERMRPPGNSSLTARSSSFLALQLNTLQLAFTAPRPTWVHVLFGA